LPRITHGDSSFAFSLYGFGSRNQFTIAGQHVMGAHIVIVRIRQFA